MPESLGEHDPRLRDIYFIEGIGLCSNIFIFAEGDTISLVDTGSGMEPNAISPQLEQLGLKIEGVTRVAITHGHIDHIGGLTEICEHSSRLGISGDQVNRLHEGWRQYQTWSTRPKGNPYSWSHRRKRVPARQRNHSHRGHCLPRRILRKNRPPIRGLEKAHRLTRQTIPFGRSSHAARTWRTAPVRGILASQVGSENRRTCQILTNLTWADRMQD